jgi:formylglycine-generating enzyme
MKKYVKCLKYSEIVSDIIDVTKLPCNDYFTNKKYDNYPIVSISQRHATFYCMWKTQMENARLEKLGKPLVHVYRLPSEAEWVYVASKPLSKKAEVNDKNAINPSISGNPNECGLYNFAGNVSEWTASYPQDKWNKTDTLGVNRDLKIVRGGSWKTNSNVDERKVLDQNTKEDYIGFRIVCSYIGNKK